MSKSKKTVDQDLIRDLAALLKETELSEIEIEQDDVRVRVARTLSPAGQVAVSAADTASPSGNEAGDPASNPGAVKSPMVGTVYLSPSPGAAAFAPIGTQVSEGQTVLIVEAMKTMNHIPAPHAGKVITVFVDNGSPVEFGEPLMIIE